MSGFSDELLSGWTDQLVARAHFGALFASDPLGTGSPASVEIAGATYSRQDASGLWTRSTARSLTLNAPLVWRSIPPGVSVAAVGFFDTAFGTGGFLHRSMLAAPVGFPAGGSWVLPAGEYAVGFNLTS